MAKRQTSRPVYLPVADPGPLLLHASSKADHVLPELPALRLEIDEHHRHKDVYEHSLTVLDKAIALEGPLVSIARLEKADHLDRKSVV